MAGVFRGSPHGRCFGSGHKDISVRKARSILIGKMRDLRTYHTRLDPSPPLKILFKGKRLQQYIPISVLSCTA